MADMDRTQYIGSSDAKRIVAGDWLALYEEKLGIRQPEDLSNVFRVQLGKHTEPFHARWLQLQMGLAITYFPDQPLSCMVDKPFIACHLDAWWNGMEAPVDLKHTNERATARSMAEDYQAQIAHQCLVTGARFGYLSFIAGNSEPELVKVEPSAAYMAQLLKLETAFWWHVESKEAPDVLPAGVKAIAKAAQAMKVNDLRKVDMTGNNQWADHARTLIETRAAADKYDAAKEEIKKLVEKDVGEAEGHGIAIKRDKRGSLRLTFKEAA